MKNPETAAEGRSMLQDMQSKCAENDLLIEETTIEILSLSGHPMLSRVEQDYLIRQYASVKEMRVINGLIKRWLIEAAAQVALAEMFERVFQNA